MFKTSRLTCASLCLLASTLLLMGFPAVAYAQVTATAQVSGTITDSSGAAIVNADVILTEIDKHTVHVAKSDSSGSYTLPNLPPGGEDTRL